MYLVIYAIMCLASLNLIECASVFNGSFQTWVICNHAWFFLIVAIYLYYGFHYKFTPGDSWPRVKLDVLVLFGCIAVSLAGLTLIETDKFLNAARGRADAHDYGAEDRTKYEEQLMRLVPILDELDIDNEVKWIDGGLMAHSVFAGI